jgi:hypothetical protein
VSVLKIHGKGDGWLTTCGLDRANVILWTDDVARVTCPRCLPAHSAPEPTRDQGAGDGLVEVNEVARLLMDEWERVEGEPVNASRVATFADMARVVVARNARRVREAEERADRWLQNARDNIERYRRDAERAQQTCPHGLRIDPEWRVAGDFAPCPCCGDAVSTLGTGGPLCAVCRSDDAARLAEIEALAQGWIDGDDTTQWGTHTESRLGREVLEILHRGRET